MKTAYLRQIGGIFASMLLAATSAHAGVTDQDILNDQNTPEDIVSYGMGPQAQRFSPMDMLTRDNIDRLVPAWAFSYGGEKQRGQEAQPIIYDGTLYVTASYSRVFAIDVRTGEEKWEYNARLPDGILPCCDVVNRGAAIYGDTIYFGSLDAKLIALDRHTGCRDRNASGRDLCRAPARHLSWPVLQPHRLPVDRVPLLSTLMAIVVLWTFAMSLWAGIGRFRGILQGDKPI